MSVYAGCLDLMGTEMLCVTRTQAIGAEGIRVWSPHSSRVCAGQCRLRQAPKFAAGTLSVQVGAAVSLCHDSGHRLAHEGNVGLVWSCSFFWSLYSSLHLCTTALGDIRME